MRCSTSLAVRPVYCQTTLTTGILIDGKMSVGVRIRTNGVSNSNSRDATTKVYGRRRAKLTIHISFSCVYFSRNGGRKFHGPFQSLDWLRACLKNRLQQNGRRLEFRVYAVFGVGRLDAELHT